MKTTPALQRALDRLDALRVELERQIVDGMERRFFSDETTDPTAVPSLALDLDTDATGTGASALHTYTWYVA